ncbi:hypothetical protein HDK64DRAFT_262278 [Phyllosticta capitalensis]
MAPPPTASLSFIINTSSPASLFLLLCFLLSVFIIPPCTKSPPPPPHPPVHFPHSAANTLPTLLFPFLCTYCTPPSLSPLIHSGRHVPCGRVTHPPTVVSFPSTSPWPP